MAINKFQTRAKLVNRVIHNEKYIQCTFEFVQPLCQPFKAGQYVSLKLGEKGELRSYSICSTPADQGKFDLMVDVTPHGLGTTFLQTAEIGTETDLLGPLGRFTLSDGIENKSVVLIGTGSGVAPLRSMALDLLQVKKTTQKVLFLWGERYSKDLIWQDELRQLGQDYQNFEYTAVISRPEEGEQCTSGRVTNCIETMELPVNAEYYLCGNKEMINDMMDLLQKKEVEPVAIFHEQFY
jgi:Na+-transporting NADH:ubiquinone oxidoreductase subunit F